jgi:alcohol dehydrogenase class IV
VKQKIIFTSNLKDKLFNIVTKLKPSKILFVTANKSFIRLNIKSLIEPITNKYISKRFFGFDNNPKLTDVNKGIKVLKGFQPDIIISIGGGSVMDMGKLINILSQNPKYKDLIRNNSNFKISKIPLIAIPTTSGTGSESTSFSVIYINNKKYSVSDMSMLPDYALIDTSLSSTMSKKLRASSAFDAFSQSIESYWSINSTKASKILSIQAIKLIHTNLIKSLNNDKSARTAMAKAANLSGQAINITKTTAPHALSYRISTKYGLQHGHAVALTLGKFFILNYPQNDINISDRRGYKFVMSTMKSLFNALGVKSSKEASDYWYNLMKKTGLEPNINIACSLTKNDLLGIIRGVDQFRLKNNPIKVTDKDMLGVFWDK